MKVMFKSKMSFIWVLFLSLLFVQCKEDVENENENDIPHIIQVNKNKVVIKWDSKERYEGVIYYRNVNKTGGRPSSGKDTRESIHHEVVISDLSPSTRYTYWIKNTSTKYEFQTEPENDKPLSFLISLEDSLKNGLSLISKENCGFILSLKEKQECNYAACNVCVPVYYFDGNNPGSEDSGKKGSWSLDWGDLKLLMVNTLDEGLPYLDISEHRTIGVVLNSGILSGDATEIASSAFHQKLLSHNKKFPNSPVIFAGIIDHPKDTFCLNGIHYFSIPEKISVSEQQQTSNAVVVNVDGQSVSVYFPGNDKEFVLNLPPLYSRRLCVECQRLEKKGLYEESIAAYKSFIEENKGLYQIEDAYFSIAEILDKKLFRFSEASKWYRCLTDSFPNSPFNSEVKQRLDYFATYPDHNFEPLEKFEQIRSVYEANDKSVRQQGQKKVLTEKQKELIGKAESINADYPECKTVPLVKLWLAKQYQHADNEKALEYYRSLNGEYLEFSKVNEVPYQIAETYYSEKLYKEAKAAFIGAKKILPHLSEKIDNQLSRTTSKIRRAYIQYIAWAIFVMILFIAFLLKPYGFRFPRLKPLLFILLGFLYSYLMFFIAGREEIIENFNSYKEISLFYIFNLMLIPLSIIVARTYTGKLFDETTVKSKIFGGLISMVFFFSAFYLILYYLYEQYLSYIML